MANVYAPELKAQVIADYTANHLSDRALERKYDIPRSTIRNWIGTLGDVRVTPENKDDIDSRVIGLTLTAIDTLEAVLRHARDAAWLQKQNAHDLAFFFGITADKITAVLAAYERGQQLLESGQSG